MSNLNIPINVYCRRYVNDFEDRRVILKLLAKAGIDTSDIVVITKFGVVCNTLQADYEATSTNQVSTNNSDLNDYTELGIAFSESENDSGSGGEQSDEHNGQFLPKDQLLKSVNWKEAYRLRYNIVYPENPDQKQRQVDSAYNNIIQVKDLLHGVQDPSAECDDLFRDIALRILQTLGKYIHI